MSVHEPCDWLNVFCSETRDTFVNVLSLETVALKSDVYFDLRKRPVTSGKIMPNTWTLSGLPLQRRTRRRLRTPGSFLKWWRYSPLIPRYLWYVSSSKSEFGLIVMQATKMTILRPACYKLFAPFIDEVYARLERGSGQPKLVFDSRSDLETFIINTINTTFDRKKSCVTVSTDFFAYGVDSLQATMIRNTLVRRLDLCNDIKLSQNIVFEHPSVQKLAGYLWDLRMGVRKAKGKSDHHATMWEMTEKWFHVLNRSSAPAKIANGHAQGATVASLTIPDSILELMALADFDRCHRFTWRTSS